MRLLQVWPWHYRVQPQAWHGCLPSEGLWFGTEFQGVESIVSWQVSCEMLWNPATWQPKRPGRSCACLSLLSDNADSDRLQPLKVSDDA